VDLHLYSVVGMILAGKTRSARRKPCLSATLSTTNFIRIGLGMSTGPRRKLPTTNHLSLDMNKNSETQLSKAVKGISYFTYYKDHLVNAL
jgi:hypothetical protein